jgi:predicted Fe-Mo cluster-binding NifX family protein
MPCWDCTILYQGVNVKIAISINGSDLNAPFSPRFGRAAAFCIVDSESDEYQVYENSAISASGGAGVMAAQFVVDHDADVVISGAYGPQAYETLAAAGAKMYTLSGNASFSIRDVLGKFYKGELQEIQAPTHGGHHGHGRRGGRGRGLS